MFNDKFINIGKSAPNIVFECYSLMKPLPLTKGYQFSNQGVQF